MRTHIKKATVRVTILAFALCAAGQAFGGTYNGPDDPAAYREPRQMRCYGVPDFPQHYNADVQGEMIGNLVDGYNYVELQGKVGILYFDLIESDKDPKRLEATFTSISTLDWSKRIAKGFCTVEKWKPLKRRPN